MGDIVVRGSMDLDEIQRWGKVFLASGIFGGQGDQQQKMAQAVIKIQYGQELGLPPFAAMDGIDIIDGKPAPNAGLTAALIKRSGKYDFRIEKSDDRGCSLSWTEYGVYVGESWFTEDDARAADLLRKTNWQKYPVDMYFSRALTRGARRFCADLFLGSVYTPEELGGDIAGPPAPEPPPPPPLEPPIPMAQAGGQRHIGWVSADDAEADRTINPRTGKPWNVGDTASLAEIPDDMPISFGAGPTTFEEEGIAIDGAIAARMEELDNGLAVSPDAMKEGALAAGALQRRAEGGRDFFGEKLQQLCAAPVPTDADWCELVLVKICANLDAAKTVEDAMRMRAYAVHLPEPHKQQAKDTIEETVKRLSGGGDADAAALDKLLAEVEECADRAAVTALMGKAQRLGLPPETWRAFYAAAQGKMVTFKPEPPAKRRAAKRG